MASLKTNFDQFSYSKISLNALSKLKSNKSLFQSNREDSPSEHQLLIQEISQTTNALNEHNQRHRHSNHLNQTTYCQKYANALLQKYSKNFLSPVCNHQKCRSQVFSKDSESDDQIICKKLVLCQRYFENIQFCFEKQYENYMLQIKHIKCILQSKKSNFLERNQNVEDQMIYIKLFIEKVNKKAFKSDSSSFAIIFSSQKGRENQQKTPILKQQQNNQLHLVNDIKLWARAKSLLLSSSATNMFQNWKQHGKSRKKLSNHLRQMPQNPSFRTQSLEYSESDFPIDLKNKNLYPTYNQQIPHQLSFSPTQPCSFRKQNQQSNQFKAKNIPKKLFNLEDSLIFDKEGDKITNEIQRIQTLIKNPIYNQINILQKLNSQFVNSVVKTKQTVQKTQTIFTQENFSLKQEWNEILWSFSKDFEQMQNLLRFEKAENDAKDKKFLENLEIIQNELIEQIFQQKQCQKVEKAIITQILSNLVNSLSQKYK